MKLAWNAIVRNESAIIDRCLDSLLPHVNCGIVVDTGSTDDTIAKIKAAFERDGKSIEIYSVPFENFSQARNEALHAARSSKLEWDYLLLADADMELRVNKPDWINGHSGPSYDMHQTGGAVTYANRRLIHRSAQGNYVGVTHEYLDVPSAGVLDGADFVDHADGSNRPDKFARDIALLEEALKTESTPGLVERYHFYLAQSYFDSEQWENAAKHYRERVSLGGFQEECWYAQRQLALCFAKLERFDLFVWEALRAYEMRPHRAESLHDLARFFRERGENFASLLFSEPGMALPPPRDEMLFVNNWIHEYGLKEEFAICAYYDRRKRTAGRRVSNRLSLVGSEQAKENSYWYVEPLVNAVQSFAPSRVPFEPEDGWSAMNPSVINDDGLLRMLIRTVNYTITPDGRYEMPGDAIVTRNFLLDQGEIFLPHNYPQIPEYPLVRGFEDSRLFKWQGKLWSISTVRELEEHGHARQVLAEVRTDMFGTRYFNYKVIHPNIPDAPHHQKNWMPWVDDDDTLRFVYRLGILLDANGELVAQFPTEFNSHCMSGGSQVIHGPKDTYLAVIHEARTIPGRPANRYYQHRFVDIAHSGRVRGISPPFFFNDRQIEFCAGLAYFSTRNELVASYGVRDKEAWVARMDVDEVIRFIYRDAGP